MRFFGPLSISLALSVLLTGCANSLRKELEKIKVGMDKTDVVETVGSPHRKRRWKGRDEWTYVYFVSGKRQGTDVVFENGEVVFIGQSKLRPDLNDQIEDATSFEDYKQKVEKKQELHRSGFKDLDNGTEE